MHSLQAHIRSSERSGEIKFVIEERREDVVVSRMPVDKGAQNPLGLIQAGAMLWLADVTASVLAIGDTEIGPNGEGFPLAIDLHTTLLGNQKGGEIRAEARFVRKGRRVVVIRTQVLGERGRLLAEVTSTHLPAA